MPADEPKPSSESTVAMIAHRLRTPLTVIMSTVDNLMDGAFGSLNEQQRIWLKKLETHTTTLESLLNDILDMLRNQSPSLPVPTSSVTPSPRPTSLPKTTFEKGKAIDGRSPKVLAVDDEPDILDIVQQGLALKGIDVITASTGEEAMQRAQNEHPDVILMDVLLDRQNGMEICRQIKSQIDSFVPVILVTGQGDLREKISGKPNEADDLLTKPFQIEELHSRVNAMLRMKKLHEDLEHAVSKRDS